MKSKTHDQYLSEAAVRDSELEERIREELSQGCPEQAMDRVCEINNPDLARQMRQIIHEYQGANYV